MPSTVDRRARPRPPRHVRRMSAVWEALGGAPDAYEIVILQLVNLLKGGQPVQMSKRAGEIATLDDLIDDIGVDAARWFSSSRSHDIARRPRLGWPRVSRRTTRSITCSTRTRGSLDPRRQATASGGGGASRPRLSSESFIPRRGGWSSACSSLRRGPRGGRPARAAPHERTSIETAHQFPPSTVTLPRGWRRRGGRRRGCSDRDLVLTRDVIAHALDLGRGARLDVGSPAWVASPFSQRWWLRSPQPRRRAPPSASPRSRGSARPGPPSTTACSFEDRAEGRQARARARPGLLRRRGRDRLRSRATSSRACRGLPFGWSTGARTHSRTPLCSRAGTPRPPSTTT